MRLPALLLIVCGIIEASYRRRHGHGRNRPIYVSEGSTTNRSTRRSTYYSSTSSSSSSASEDSTDTSWDGTVSNYSFDPTNSSVYSSQYDSDSLEQSVISTFQQSLQEDPAQVRRTRASRNLVEKKAEVKERRGKETEIFQDMVRRHTGGAGNEMPAKRLSTREQTAQIQGPRRSQVGEARRNSILRQPTTQEQPEAQQQPHYLYTSYHEDSSDNLEREQSIPSDQSYTIEFSSEHHRRFRRHISRSNNNPAAIPAILAQPEVKISTPPK